MDSGHLNSDALECLEGLKNFETWPREIQSVSSFL